MTSHYLPHTDARRSVLCLLAGLVATWAFAGALGLITSVVTLDEAESHLPWHSPILAGVTLALVVGLPMTAVALTAAHGDPHCAATTATDAAALIAWTLLQLVVLRELTWLQPISVLLAVAVASLGMSDTQSRSGLPR
ncbi:hypothetical protein [Nocardia sp. NPDC003979]